MNNDKDLKWDSRLNRVGGLAAPPEHTLALLTKAHSLQKFGQIPYTVFSNIYDRSLPCSIEVKFWLQYTVSDVRIVVKPVMHQIVHFH